MNPVFYLYKKMWRFSKGNRKQVVLFMVLLFFANVLIQMQPLIIGLILNYIQSHRN